MKGRIGSPVCKKNQMRMRGEIREGVRTSLKGKEKLGKRKVWGNRNNSKKVISLESKANLEKGRIHQKIQITIKVVGSSSNQKLKSSLIYGVRMMEKTSLQRELEMCRGQSRAEQTQRLFSFLKTILYYFETSAVHMALCNLPILNFLDPILSCF